MSKTYKADNFPKRSSTLNAKTYEQWYKRSIDNPHEFWSEKAREFLDWESEWHETLSYDYHNAEISWFKGGKLNVTKNCIDRHLSDKGQKPAIIWEGNRPGENRTLTYTQLHQEVSKYANILENLGIKKGDRVAIYLPMIPELAISMLACARIGAIHTVIFAGFSADSIRDRVNDCQASLIITANEALRGEKKIALKEIVDKAIDKNDYIKNLILIKRTDAPVDLLEGRDHLIDNLLETASEHHTPVLVDAEDPLFILYTSGSTGKPKGVLHTSGGYLLYTAVTHRYVFDYADSDIYFCAADIGWITGHSYIVYGPLCNGATTVMFESIPTYPDAGRYWDIVERLGVNIFYTAPTAIRAIAKEGMDYVDNYDLSSLRVLGSVGEPINEDAWKWYYENIGGSKCALVDTWWQTETGGILISPLPGINDLKPGSATRPLFGIKPVLVDDDLNPVTIPYTRGRLCIEFPWPGQMRGVYGDSKRFKDTYFKDVPGKYFSGDAAFVDEDGYFWITGRMDDVLNVSGHRLGTAELESAIVHSGLVAEAAIVGIPHEIKGTALCAFCILQSFVDANDENKKKINNAVRESIGPFAAIDNIYAVPGLPKTRSGKIMRRILRKIASGDVENIGDTSTLAEPQVVQSIIEQVSKNT